MKSGIYMILNHKSSWCYIGASKDLDLRRKSHFTKTSNRFLNMSMSSYGKNSFSFDILENVDVVDLRKREDWWIKRAISDGVNLYNDVKDSRYALTGFDR